jgi:hypothetical protein
VSPKSVSALVAPGSSLDYGPNLAFIAASICASDMTLAALSASRNCT